MYQCFHDSQIPAVPFGDLDDVGLECFAGDPTAMMAKKAVGALTIGVAAWSQHHA
jgi:hypothetical protein